MTNKRYKAFTIAELLVVVMIIGIIASIAVPNLLRAGLKGRESSLKVNLKLIRSTVEMFRTDTGAYPAKLSDLTGAAAPAFGKDLAGANKSITATDWKGPYLPSVDADPVSKQSLNYSVSAGTVGKVWSSASGASLDGTLYQDW